MKKLFTLIAILFTGYWASASCTGSFTSSVSGYHYVNFTNTSTPPSSTSPMAAYANWNFGDGGVSSSWNATHNYLYAGTYTVTLYVEWVDSATSSYICDDTVTSTVTVTYPSGVSGTIIRDSGLGTVPWDSLWVWLITYDTATHIISAVDSQRLVASGGATAYSFTGVTPGSYLLKAAGSFGSSGSGFVPTYHYSSASWSSAGYVSVTSATMTTGQDIYMQYGTLTSGPGFIAGDVTLGAGKGTAVGDPVVGLTIYLLNNTTGKVISATTTDATGKYSFNVPFGTYTIYPEHAGLLTTAWNSITVSSTGSSVNTINFKQNSKSIVPSTAAVPQVTVSNSIAVYPNPAHGFVSIQWNGAVKNTADVTISDIIGKKVYQSTWNVNTTVSNINISELPTGTYIMNITAAEGSYQQKLIIK